MTPKERVLSLLNNKNPDRIPWSPLMGYNFINAQSKSIRNLGLIGLWKKLKIDIIDRETVTSYGSRSRNVKVRTLINGKEVKIPEEENNWQHEVPLKVFLLYKYRDPSIKIIEKYFETPLGTLKSSYINSPSSKTVFQNEYFIKEKKDLKILEYMYKDLEFFPTYNEVVKTQNLIGEDGIVAAGAPGSPVIELIEEYMGVEKFLFFLNDYPEEMRSLIDVMLEKYLEVYQIVSGSPCPLIVVWEDTGTGLYSPKIFGEYIAPVLKKYADVSHKCGKKIFVHSCGLLKDIIINLIKTGIDGIMDMTPPPIGNIDFLEARKKVGKDVILTGGIGATIITSSDKKLLEKTVVKLIREMKPYGNFILGSGDSVPADTPIENLELVYKLTENYGDY